jgi:hypothetical protein
MARSHHRFEPIGDSQLREYGCDAWVQSLSRPICGKRISLQEPDTESQRRTSDGGGTASGAAPDHDYVGIESSSAHESPVFLITHLPSE